MNEKQLSSVSGCDTGTMDLQRNSTVISSELSRKLTAISFFCACCIVLLHANLLSTPCSKATYWIMAFFSYPVLSFAVPMFFAISGYLVAKKTDCGRMAGWYPSILKKRIRTLGIPYLTWCTIYGVTFVPFTLLGNHLAGRELIHNTYLSAPLLSFRNIGNIYGIDMFGFPAAGILWYIRNLMILFLISHLIFFVIRRRFLGLPFLLLTGVLFWIHSLIPEPEWQFFETGFSLRGLFFYSCGAYFACFPLKAGSCRLFKIMLLVIWIICSVVLTCLMLQKQKENVVFVQFLLKLVTTVGVCSIWYAYDVIPGFKRITDCSFAGDSFFIYVSHYLVLSLLFCQKVQIFWESRLHVPVFGIYLLRFLVPLALSLLTAEFLKRFLPRVYGVLTGGR